MLDFIMHSEKYNSFSPEIQACLTEVETHYKFLRTPQYDLFKPYCEKLMTFAAQEQSDYLFALSYFYMMEYSTSDNDYINTISCALQGIKYQQTVQEYQMVARSYNILGVFTEQMGDYAKATEYLLCSIDFSAKYHLDYLHCMAASNLANLLFHASSFDRAVYYFTEAERFFYKSQSLNLPLSIAPLLFILCNKGFCSLSIQKYEDADECSKRLLQCLEEQNDDIPESTHFMIYTYLASWAYARKNEEQVQYYLDLAERKLDAVDNYIAYIDDLCHYIRLFIQLEKYDKAIFILNYFLKRCEDDHAPFPTFTHFMDMRIECTQLTNNTEDYIKYSKRFLEEFRADRTRNSEVTLRAENTHRENARLQKQQYELHLLNEKLLLQSQHDTLTGLPNRAFLNSYAEETLSNAQKNQVSFGIEILDIDSFKQINDTYGHLDGDRYLCNVSDQLQKVADEYDNIFVSRYGGDEFVIVYYGKTDEEILTIMQALKDAVAKIPLPDQSPAGHYYVTLSQGCCNRIPQPLNRLWDFLSVADTALYQVKQDGKNNYKLLRKNQV